MNVYHVRDGQIVELWQHPFDSSTGTSSEGMDPGQSLRLAHQLGLASAGQVGVDALLQGDQASLLQTDGLGSRGRRLREIGSAGPRHSASASRSSSAAARWSAREAAPRLTQGAA